MSAASNYMALTGQLRRGRRLNDETQADMARMIGVSRRTFQRWEDGEAMPDALQLFRWAALVGVEIASVLTHEEKPKAAA